jgi:TRAP-type C4-dicarboxylate transport system permease small subunit
VEVIPVSQFLRTCNTRVHRAMLLVAELALMGMVLIVIFTVFLRYVFNTGIGWAEEVPRLLVTLFAFLAMGMGVRDNLHIGVNLFYNMFPKDGAVRKFLIVFGDLIVLLCGLFMLYHGYRSCATLFNLPGRLPMTGLATWWQYLPIPMAGFVITFDSILFLTGVLKRDDFLYTEPEVDYEEEYKKEHQTLTADRRG